MAKRALRALKKRFFLLVIEPTFVHLPTPSGVGCGVAFASATLRQGLTPPEFEYPFF